MRNRMTSIYVKRMNKRLKEYEPRQHDPFVRQADITARDVATLVRDVKLYDHGHILRNNQRQKRKRWRMAPHTRPKR